ncbi:hypothetical protein Vadar_019077 [Vaccinium darrowii]|uniref:Uncharacterized protein n=1 Tax=Vaccinium darrowii TaxID=229202 RepID=A0ACB7ZK53_9ERIC|nr:hypothetical protein Vadar_019077 [Vaccinium darrowii]
MNGQGLTCKGMMLMKALILLSFSLIKWIGRLNSHFLTLKQGCAFSRMTLADDVNLEEFFMTKEEFSGADIKAKCTEVGLLALRERPYEGETIYYYPSD